MSAFPAYTANTPLALGAEPLWPPYEDGDGVFLMMFRHELQMAICDAASEGATSCACCGKDLPTVEYDDFWFPLCFECFRVEAGDRHSWHQKTADIETYVRQTHPQWVSTWLHWWDMDEADYYDHCKEEIFESDDDGSDSDYVPDDMEVSVDAPPPPAAAAASPAAVWDPNIQEDIANYYEQQHDAEINAILNGLHGQINDNRVIDLRTPEPQVEVIDLRTPEPEAVEAIVVHEPNVRRREGPVSPVTNEDRAMAVAMLRDLQGAGTVDDPVVL